MASAIVSPNDWKNVVYRVIASWGGYQLGVDFSSGGPETLAKDEVGESYSHRSFVFTNFYKYLHNKSGWTDFSRSCLFSVLPYSSGSKTFWPNTF